MKRMRDNKTLWDESLRKFKILRIKANRAIHRLHKKTRISFVLKNIILIGAMKAITAVAPGVQINLYSQNNTKNLNTKEMFALNYVKNRDLFPTAQSYTQDSVVARQSDFAKDLWKILNANIEEIKEGTEKGQKSKTIRKVFGNDVNPRYYCSISGLRSLEQTINKKGYHEYDFLLRCIANPHACLSVIDGLEKHFGKHAKTENIKNKLHNELKNNANSVCIAIVNSSANSSSGKHFVFVLPNKVVIDGAINEVDTLAGTVVSFNVDKIASSEAYFKGPMNTGYLFNITKIAESDLIKLFYNKYKRTQTKQENEMIMAQSQMPMDNVQIRQQIKKNIIAWEAVSSKSQRLQ